MLFDEMMRDILSIESNLIMLEEYWETNLPQAFKYASELRDYISYLREMEEVRPSKASMGEDFDEIEYLIKRQDNQIRKGKNDDAS